MPIHKRNISNSSLIIIAILNNVSHPARLQSPREIHQPTVHTYTHTGEKSCSAGRATPTADLSLSKPFEKRETPPIHTHTHTHTHSPIRERVLTSRSLAFSTRLGSVHLIVEALMAPARRFLYASCTSASLALSAANTRRDRRRR